jgi:hypothetical protein
MRAQTMLTALVVLMAGALPLSAQQGAESGGGLSTMDRADHAAIGTVASVGMGTNQVTISTPRASDLEEQGTRVFDTNETTAVEGLGSMSDVTGLREHVGGIVVVRYNMRGAEHPMAKEVTFIGPGEIRATHGALTRVDAGKGEFTLRNDEGGEESMQLNDIDRTPIDTSHGLVPMSDLRVGENVIVYFMREPGPMGEPGDAYLVRRTDT